MGSILVIKLGALGDLFLADGALRDIRDHHPDCSITLLTRQAYATLMHKCPWIDRVLIDANLPRWRLDAMRRLRNLMARGEFMRIYDLQNSRRTAFYRRWLAPRSIDWCALADGRSSGGLRGPKSLSVPERHASQLARAGLTISSTLRPRIGWLAAPADALLRSAGVSSAYVVLLPGSSRRHPQKRWPYFSTLAGELAKRGHRVVIVPGPDEPDIHAAENVGIVLRDQGNPVSLPQLAAILRDAACVVGNDSGPTHLAACLDVPGIALFETGNPSRTLTGIERRNFTCLAASSLGAISVEEVSAAVQERIDCSGYVRSQVPEALREPAGFRRITQPASA